MNVFDLKNVAFTYPNSEKAAINNIDFTVESGSFLLLCGKSGSGKTTLLRLLKPALTPHGTIGGEILYKGKRISEISQRCQAEEIGFVLQSPENQTVTDMVWHELAFGPESLGMSQNEIRLRVAEMASYFGIEQWFHRRTSQLSGGQKQILALASVMTMSPKVLILDEPTAQLDPIAAGDFLSTVAKINRDLGVTVIMTEHRLDEVLPLTDRIIVLENGEIISDGNSTQTADTLSKTHNDMFTAMPAPMKLYAALTTEHKYTCPVNIREGRAFIEKLISDNEYTFTKSAVPAQTAVPDGESALTVKDVWFRYEKKENDILKGVSLSIPKGSIFAVLGGNGSGKSTLLKIICGIKKHYCGNVSIHGKISMLPQDPTTLFTKNTVRDELASYKDSESVTQLLSLLGIEKLTEFHPYDLSGGEQQKLALAKVLLTNADILLLDEPTKSLDAFFKRELSELFKKLTKQGKTIVIVSHDIEFCAENADGCALLFDGAIAAQGEPVPFFGGNSFYTTAVNRMTADLVPDTVTVSDLLTSAVKT